MRQGTDKGSTVCDLFPIIYNMGEEAQKINIEMKLPSSRWLGTPSLCMVSMCPCHLLKK